MWFTSLKFVKLPQWNEWPYSRRSNKNEWTKIDQDKKDFAPRMDSRLFQSCGWGFVNSWCQCFVSQKQSFHGSGFFYQIDLAHLDLTQNLSPESEWDNNYCVWPLCQTEQNHKILQFVLCQINIFCHQLTQNTITEFVRYSKIYTNCSEIQNLIKSDKLIVIFWVNWWQLFPLKRQLFSLKTSLSQYSFLYSLA